MKALLVIDVQRGFDDPMWGTRNNPEMEENILSLLQKFREKNLPVYHVKHNSRNPDSPLHPKNEGNRLKDGFDPLDDEVFVTKKVNSAFMGTFLDEELQADAIHELVIVGLTTDHCVSTTARMAANLGYQVTIPTDATATFNRGNYPAEVIHDVELKILEGEFATIITTKELLTSL